METSPKSERPGRPAPAREGVPPARGAVGPLGGRAAGPLLDFLASAGPKAESLLASYRLPPAVTEEILAETLQALVWKWETVRDREAWLLAVLEGRCRAASSRGGSARLGVRPR